MAAGDNDSSAEISSERTVFDVVFPVPNISIKLTARNYLLWRTQLVTFLRDQNLLGFVDGTIPCPSSATLSRAAWIQQDQAILSILISTLSEEAMHLAVGKTTSRQLWVSIGEVLGSQMTTRARTLRLLCQLHGLRQGDESVEDYIGRAQVLVEDLALAGRPVDLDDQNLYVFRGLRSEFRPLVATLIVKGDPLTLAQLSDFLVANEEFICDIGGAGRRCQICGVNGHTAVYCHHRYSTNFGPRAG